MSSNPIIHLYKRLLDIGISEEEIYKKLPDWWDNEIALNRAGYSEILMILSRELQLDLKSMQDITQRIKFKNQ